MSIFIFSEQKHNDICSNETSFLVSKYTENLVRPLIRLGPRLESLVFPIS